MPKKSKPNKTDLNIFHESIKGVKPLVHNKIRLTTPSQNQKKIRHKNKEEAFDLKETLDILPVRGNESLSYKQDSVSYKILRKLNKGQYNVDAILDLHGMTIEKARKAVDLFLQECLYQGIQVALIIHGKGLLHSQGPVLKNKLNQWLRTVSFVLAFCSATIGHGSQGAIYVLLKQSTKEGSVE